MRTIHVSPDFQPNQRMQKAVRRGKLRIVQDAPDRGGMDDKVRVYWDNSNMFQGAKTVAEGLGALGMGEEVRIDFRALAGLAFAGRRGLTVPDRKEWDIAGREYSAVIAASTPPSERALWNQMGRPENVRILKKFDRRGGKEQNDPGNEQQVPDMQLRLEMMQDVLDSPSPGVAVLLSGDGGFLPFMRRMHAAGWAVEVLTWDGCCGKTLRRWARENGVYVPLEHYREKVTYKGIATRAWDNKTFRRKVVKWKTTHRSAPLPASDLLRRPKASPSGGGGTD